MDKDIRHKNKIIIKALTGLKFNWGEFGLNIGSQALDIGLSSYFKNKANQAQINANNALLEAFKKKSFADAYKEALASLQDRSDIVNTFNAYNQANGLSANAISEKMQLIEMQNAQIQLQSNLELGLNIGNLLKNAGMMYALYQINKSK